MSKSGERFRQQMIKLRLGGSNDPLEPFPQEPRGMHWRTYRQLRDQAHAARAEADYLLLAHCAF
jgi:hypothetical protein